MGNMNCSGQKANSKDYNKNYNRIFKKQFFDTTDVIDKILEEANQVKEMRYCSVCRAKCGEMVLGDWEVLWNTLCDDCANELSIGGKE